jgi:hypothetical protein
MRYWRRLETLNEVTDPWHMPPGMRLGIPLAWLRVQPAEARVVAVHGEAEVLLADKGRKVPATVGLALRSGDEVHTGAGANLTLEFADGSQLLVQSQTRAVMDSLRAYGETGLADTRIRVPQGRTETRVTPRTSPGSPRFEIRTPAAASAVRGTRFRVSAEAAQPVSRTEVTLGTVGVTGAGETRLVPKRYGTVARAGAPPLPPTPLLPPPDLSGLPKIVERVPVQLAVPPLPGAVSYRAQIAKDEAFKTLLYDTPSNLPRFRGPDLPDGDYVLRVRGIDVRGLEGLDAVHRVAIDDFGTGYSSLNYLKRFPIDRLKIDRSFVRDVTTDPDAASITTAVIALARSMRLRVTADGVETGAQLEFLRCEQCDEVQGFYLSRPLAAADLARFLLLRRDPPPPAP